MNGKLFFQKYKNKTIEVDDLIGEIIRHDDIKNVFLLGVFKGGWSFHVDVDYEDFNLFRNPENYDGGWYFHKDDKIKIIK